MHCLCYVAILGCYTTTSASFFPAVVTSAFTFPPGPTGEIHKQMCLITITHRPFLNHLLNPLQTQGPPQCFQVTEVRTTCLCLQEVPATIQVRILNFAFRSENILCATYKKQAQKHSSKGIMRQTSTFDCELFLCVLRYSASEH